MTNQLPAFLQNRQSKALAPSLVANLGVGTPPYISIANNRFTLVDAGGAEEPVATYDPKTGPYLDCVIVDSNDHLSKVFYDKPYDPSASQYEPPACFSDNGVGPSRAAPRPQSPTCAQCPNAVWGSKISAVSGKGVKACSDQQKLAIMIPGDEVVFLMRVPPNTLSNLRTYINKFTVGIDVSDVITRIVFESQGTLQFVALSLIDEAIHARREALYISHRTDGLVGRTDLPREMPAALPAAAAPLALPAAQPAAQPSTPPVQQQAPQQAMPEAAAPAALPSEAPRQRRRRASAEPAHQAAAPAAQSAPAMAPFRPEATAPAQPANFGIQQGAAPDAALQQTLSSIFGPGQ